MPLPFGFQPNIIFWRGDDAPWNMQHGLLTVGEGLYKGGWTTFNQARAVISLCAPGRMAGMTGLFPQRHLMWDNASGEDLDFTQTYFVDLARAGYTNFVGGKWINGYGENGHGGFTTTIPFPGVHKMVVIYGAPNYDDNTFKTETGANHADSGGTGDAYYYPDLWKTHALTFLAGVPVGQPWSIYIGDKASHIDNGDNVEVAARYQNTSITWTDDPGFGVDPTGGTSRQPQHIIDNAIENWGNGDANDARALHLDRLRSLRSSDDSLKAIIDQVVTRGELNKTLIIISCDQTDFSGQLQCSGGKGTNHWASNMLALQIRRPVANGSSNNVCNAPVMDCDLAETVRDACGAGHSWGMPDGMSLVPLLTNPEMVFREAVPYFNLHKPPEVVGFTKGDGRTYGKGVPWGRYPADHYCWTDLYCTHNTGPDQVLSKEADVLLDINGRGP